MQKSIKIIVNDLPYSKIVRVVSDDSPEIGQDNIATIVGPLKENGNISLRVLWNNLPHIIELEANRNDICIDDVILINPKAKKARILYRRGSNSNTIFATSRCNSLCLMCPQPPKENEEVDFDQVIEQIKALPENVEELCITGGEPTLLGDKFIEILKLLAASQPNCHVHVLSNARACCSLKFSKSIAEAGISNLSFGIPLYSADANKHDFIVQHSGAFDETIAGIYNLARFGTKIEIRIVLHKQTYQELKLLSQFIYNRMPYASHVAFMAMEHMGFVKKHWDILWINPRDYADELSDAIRYLHRRGINCSIYNLPYCLCPKSLWPFLRNSISDYKVDYADACHLCVKESSCGGLFHYQINSMPVTPILGNEME